MDVVKNNTFDLSSLHNYYVIRTSQRQINITIEFSPDPNYQFLGIHPSFTPHVSSTYQNAVDTCTSRGADLVLPISQSENTEVAQFLTSNYNAGNFQSDPVAWLRVSNDGSGWVDSKTDEVPGYGGPGSEGGHNLSGYPNHANMLVGEFRLAPRLTIFDNSWKIHPENFPKFEFSGS